MKFNQKKIYLFSIITILIILTGFQISARKNFRSNFSAKKCSPTGTCNACKNCKYCQNCSKNGGSCSVCK